MFSATASFGVGAVLGFAGVIVVAKSNTKPQDLFATIPLIFVVQPFTGGMLWLSLKNTTPRNRGGGRYYFDGEDLGVNSDSIVFLQIENFVLMDKNWHIRGIYNGLDPYRMQALKNDMVVLKKEYSNMNYEWGDDCQWHFKWISNNRVFF